MIDVPREDMDSTWCVYCCHSHPSGAVCGAEYVYVPEIGRDFCGCGADHHPEPDSFSDDSDGYARSGPEDQ